MSDTEHATVILGELRAGSVSAADRLLPIVYDELRALAGRYFRRERANHTLQPTAIVHEAFVRLINQQGSNWKDRAHFFAVAATAMRQILTDYARRHGAEKRGGGAQRVELDDAAAVAGCGVDMIGLDDALRRLAEMDARKHRVIELRFFGGLSVEEVAEVLGVSKTTVESDWRAARAWLSVQLGEE